MREKTGPTFTRGPLGVSIIRDTSTNRIETVIMTRFGTPKPGISVRSKIVAVNRLWNKVRGARP